MLVKKLHILKKKDKYVSSIVVTATSSTHTIIGTGGTDKLLQYCDALSAKVKGCQMSRIIFGLMINDGTSFVPKPGSGGRPPSREAIVFAILPMLKSRVGPSRAGASYLRVGRAQVYIFHLTLIGM